ncbi:Hpt domain-containing protein [Myxococcota bacterium]|nr:Hpt domain-containing protein [Myxococcota bacterium]
MSPSEAPVPVDLARMLEAADGDREFLRQLVEVFLEDADLKASEIRSAVQAQDLKGLGRTAHQLKGASANVGAAWLQDVAKRLELASRAESLGDVGDLLARLDVELVRVHEQLEPILRAP